jgi:hypothetical protein
LTTKLLISIILTINLVCAIRGEIVHLIDRNNKKVESRKDSKEVQEENMDLKLDKVLTAITSLEKSQVDGFTRLESGQAEIKSQIAKLEKVVIETTNNQRTLVTELRTLNYIKETPVLK